MYHLFKSLYLHATSKQEYSILLLGLDNAGKTTLLEQIKSIYASHDAPHEPNLKTVPTVGQNVSLIDLPDLYLRIWDVGGQHSLRGLWQSYYSSAHAIVFVIDSTDIGDGALNHTSNNAPTTTPVLAQGEEEGRLNECKLVLEDVLQHSETEGVPVLVLANKQDREDCVEVVRIKEGFVRRVFEGEKGQNVRDSRVLPLSALTGTGLRNIILSAALIVVLFVLLRTYDTPDLRASTRHSLHTLGTHISHAASGAHAPPRIVKVTSLFGQANELYAAAIRSHEEHDDEQGYELRVLRERVVDDYLSLPTYLLAEVVEELAKPVEERSEWLAWFGPDIILLNPHIPLELFLPPTNLTTKKIHFLGTYDTTGLNPGVFFLRVHEWSVKLLLEVLTVARSAHGDNDKALETVLKAPKFREHVAYQPRKWYNAYQLNKNDSEADAGSLLVHFHGLGGDKWSAMAETMAALREGRRGRDAAALEETTYESETTEYWARLAEAWALLKVVQAHRPEEEGAREAVRRLEWAATYEMDKGDVLSEALTQLKEKLSLVGD